MKEQWKKLDSDAKLLLNVEEGRSLPIKIELPLSAFSQDKDGCCKRLVVTLRVFVLLALLVLLSWMAIILYTNYRTKSSVVIQDDEIPIYFNEENKISFQKKVWEEDVKNTATNNVPISEEIQEKMIKKISSAPEYFATIATTDVSKQIDSDFKPESEPAESEQVSLDQLFENLQDLVKKIDTNEEATENIVKEEVNFTETPEDQNKQEEILPILTFLGSFIEPMLVNESAERLQDSVEKIQEENEDLGNVHEEVSDLTEHEKNGSEESDSESTPIRKWLEILGIKNMFTDVNENNETQTNFPEFSEDSEEAAKENIDTILMQVIEENQDVFLDQFIKDVIDAVGNAENDNDESLQENKISTVGSSENSQSSSENKHLVDSEHKPENDYQKHSSEETKDYLNIEEDSSIANSDLLILGNPPVLPDAEESMNQNSEELIKTDEDDTIQSTEDTFRGVMQKDIYLLMARRIEAILGEYEDLLIWYFKNPNVLEPEDDEGRLKYFTARLLFSKDITEFSKYSVFVVSFLMNDDYTRDFSRLVDQSQPKLETETRTQAQIVNRLVTKSHIRDLYNQGDENAEEIADAIERINLLELRLSGIDVDTFLNSLEENKSINESVKEEDLSDEIDDNPEKRHQAIIEAMRRVAHFDEAYSQELRDADSNESKKDDSKESREDTVTSTLSEETNNNSDPSIKEDNESSTLETKSWDPSVFEVGSTDEVVKSESDKVSAEESSDESIDRRQAFIKALERIAEIAVAEKSSEESKNNSDQLINEDEEESSPETIIKESEEIPSVQSLEVTNEQESIAEEIPSNENSEIDVAEDELAKRLHSFMEDVLNSEDESEEAVNMNDFLTIYDGFDDY